MISKHYNDFNGQQFSCANVLVSKSFDHRTEKCNLLVVQLQIHFYRKVLGKSLSFIKLEVLIFNLNSTLIIND